MNLKKVVISALVSGALGLVGCEAQDTEQSDETVVDGESIELTYVNWDTEIASTHVVGEVLDRVGYDVTLTSVESPVMWQSIASGESDAMVAA